MAILPVGAAGVYGLITPWLDVQGIGLADRASHAVQILYRRLEPIHLMSNLELKVPPVALVLLAGGLMWLIAATTPELSFVAPVRQVLAAAGVGLGLAIVAVGIWSFRKVKTTVNPMKPESSSVLVTAGIYNWTRNPMYLGFLCLLVGWGIFLSNALALLVPVGFVLYMNRFQIEPEEQALTRLFGQAFLTYRIRVRRWI